MNYNTVKKLHGVALLLEAIALLITLLMTIGQKFVKPVLVSSAEVIDIKTIPVDVLISVIPILILFGISFSLMSKNNGRGSISHVVACLTVALALRILIPYINMLTTRIFATLGGVNYFASYSALGTAINYVISPLEVVAFALFCLSLGGYYVIKGQEEQ